MRTTQYAPPKRRTRPSTIFVSTEGRDPVYEYRAVIIRIVDGDTIHATIDLGLDVRVDVTLRLAGINAPERGTVAGGAATAYLKSLVGPLPATVTVRTVKDRREKYGRYLAGVILDDGSYANALMVTSGHAVPYSGGSRS